MRRSRFSPFCSKCTIIRQNGTAFLTDPIVHVFRCAPCQLRSREIGRAFMVGIRASNARLFGPRKASS